jgi:hypothetical protein
MPKGRPMKDAGNGAAALPAKSSKLNGNGANLGFEQAFKNIDDVLWKEAGCTTELDYTEQTSWLLFPEIPRRP